MGAYNSPNDLGASNFIFKDNYVNVDKTTSPHHVAHPDSTILLAGLARLSVNNGTTININDLFTVGTAQQISIQESQAVQPLKELGSSRFIMTTTNAPVGIQMNSLLINGPNLLKALYRAALAVEGVDLKATFNVSQFAAMADGAGGWCNLDYPIFSIPFGLGIISRSIASQDIMSIYAECCLVQSWTWSIASGQTSVMTNVTIIADRVLPISFGFSTDNNTIEQAMNKLTTNSAQGIAANADSGATD